MCGSARREARCSARQRSEDAAPLLSGGGSMSADDRRCMARAFAGMTVSARRSVAAALLLRQKPLRRRQGRG